MSAFIVSNRTMTRAIAAIKHVGAFSEFGWATEKELGDHLYGLNDEAVAQRYNEPRIDIEYKPEPGLVFTKVDALKALSCLTYQCCEGNVPDTATYKLLDEVEKRLASRILSELPEYQNASWNSLDDEPALLEIGY